MVSVHISSRTQDTNMTSGMRDDVTVRPATYDDYDAVMEISEDIYDGNDYLPTFYRIILQSKTSNAFVVVSGGKVAGYVNYQVMDEGRICVKMALRVGRIYRGLGLSRILEGEAVRRLRERYPDVQRLSWTAVNHEATQAAVSTDHNKTLHFTWRHFIITLDASRLPLVADTADLRAAVTNTRGLTLTQSLQLFSCSDVIKDLFPRKYFVSECMGSWTPFVTNQRNLRHVAFQGSVFVSSTLGGSSCDAVSVATTYSLAPSGVLVEVWCHGNNLDACAVFAHAFCALNNTSLPVSPEARLTLGLNFPSHVNQQEVKNYFSSITATEIMNLECVVIDQEIL